jgi:hypothetical protein
MIDPRGPRFAAAVTTVVLAVVVLTGNAWLLAAQTLVFGSSARSSVCRRPPTAPSSVASSGPGWLRQAELEAEAPPRFAQLVGFAFGAVGTFALAFGATTVGLVATGMALAAAFLNAAFGFCLGCEVYLLGRRILGPRAAAATTLPHTPATSEELSA